MTHEKRKDTISMPALIGANLIPLAGILLFNWDVKFVVLLYWLENLVAGFYNILKMALLRTDQTGTNLGKIFLIPFFCIHYGGFCAVHGMILSAIFQIGSGPSPLDSGGTWLGPLVFLQLLFSVIARIWQSRPPEMIWAVIGLIISHGISFVENYILGREFLVGSLKELMHRPYQRIVIMHLAIIVGGFFVMSLNSPMPLMVALVLLKIICDIYLHRKAHKINVEKS